MAFMSKDSVWVPSTAPHRICGDVSEVSPHAVHVFHSLVWQSVIYTWTNYKNPKSEVRPFGYVLTSTYI